MPDNESPTLESSHRTPWNKGKLIGAKPPLPGAAPAPRGATRPQRRRET
jgi:hypothetical protein